METRDLADWCRGFLAGFLVTKPCDAIRHLDGIASEFATTSRFRIHYLRFGPDQGEAVVFLHGNGASSTWWEETMIALPPTFRAIAPDLRGYGLSDRSALVDATRGVQDWVDDLYALLDSLSVDRFHLVGHSLGGLTSWGVMADSRASGRLRTVTVVAPGPPCGFGGVHGESGLPNNPDFAGSGGGLVHPRFVKLLAKRVRSGIDPFSPRAVMNRLFWKPPFRPAREEDFLTAMLQMHLGPNQYPGDSVPLPHWPGVAPGRFGPVNAISPKYNCDLARTVLAAKEKPPVLFVIGADDLPISDNSLSDPGMQGKLGLRPGWPGDAVFPPQPLRSQLNAFLRDYEQCGGRVTRAEFPDCGHSPFVEKPLRFQGLLAGLIATAAGR